MALSVAAVLLALKAVLGLWAGVVLLAASPEHPRSFLGAEVVRRRPGLGALVLVLAAASLVVAAGLAGRKTWARAGALALEGFAVLLALTRLITAPGAAVVSLVLSIVVLALVLRAGGDAFVEPRRA